MAVNMLPLPRPSWWDDKTWGRVQDDPEVWELRSTAGKMFALIKRQSSDTWRVYMPGILSPCTVQTLERAWEEVAYVMEREYGLPRRGDEQ